MKTKKVAQKTNNNTKKIAEKSAAQKRHTSLLRQNTKELNKRKRRMLVVDVEASAADVAVSTALSAEAIERSKVLTFPCKDCGVETNPTNRSILQDGRVVHIGCPKKKNSTPREIEKRKPALSGLPKHRGAKVPVRPEAPVSEFGDMVVMSDYQGRTVLQLKRDINTVTYVHTYADSNGYHLAYEPVTKFDERFKRIDYPLVKAVGHCLKFALEAGATQDVLGYFGRVVTITEEQHMAAKKKLATKTTTVTDKVTGQKVTKPKGEKKASAANLFKDLIMKGGQTDDQIFAKVKEAFGLDDKKRGYVAWYRNHLKKSGQNPPDAKAAKGEKPAAKPEKKAPAKGKKK